MNEEQLQEILDSTSDNERSQRIKVNIILLFAALTLLAVVGAVAMTVSQPWLVAFLFTVVLTIGLLTILTKE